MSTLLYLDCFSGVSGNMLLGAFLDIGVPEDYLRKTISALDVDRYQLEITRQQIHHFDANLVQVHCEKSHHHRTLKDIIQILANSSLHPDIIDKAGRIFQRLAEAEAAVHGATIDTIHFHEVGAVDAIIDIVGTVACLHYLAIAHIVCSPLPMTRGWVQCEHGEIPLPAPAVCKLLEQVPVYGESLQQELVTPTGAAIVVTLANAFGPMPSMVLQKTGYGAGTMKRQDNRPNLLRLHTGEQLTVDEEQIVEVLDTHIDDWNPEFWPYVSQKLMDTGALDVSLIPIHMKKGRPGFLIRVISTPEMTPKLQNIIFTETSSIGIRRRQEYRTTLPRAIISVKTPWGEIKAKKIDTARGVVITPEYESCQQVAKKNNIPLQAVYSAAAGSNPLSGD